MPSSKFFEKRQNMPTVNTILTYIDKTYPDLCLNDDAFEQLMWLQDNTVSTSQSHIQTTSESINIEIKRILSRLACFRYLEQGGQNAYTWFTQAQPEECQLTQEQFNQLSAIINT